MTTTLHGNHAGSDTEFEFSAQGVTLTVMSGIASLPSYIYVKQTENIPHTHSWYELFYVLSGEILCSFDGEQITLRTGEMLLIPPGKAHFTNAAVSNAELCVFNFSITTSKDAKRDPVAYKLLSNVMKISGYYRFYPDPECVRSAKLLSNALDNENALFAGTYLWELLLHVGALTVSDERQMMQTLSDNNISRIYKLEQIFVNYYRCNISLSALAAELNLSVRQLARIIQKQYGCSFREKINSMRMTTAAHLLVSGNKTVTEIAEEIGYDSMPCFYRIFERTYGCLPTEYRAKMQTDKITIPQKGD